MTIFLMPAICKVIVIIEIEQESETKTKRFLSENFVKIVLKKYKDNA